MYVNINYINYQKYLLTFLKTQNYAKMALTIPIDLTYIENSKSDTISLVNNEEEEQEGFSNNDRDG